jgi:acetyl esterase/lipase
MALTQAAEVLAMTTATAFAGAPAARSREAVIAGVIGNTLEWYDFAVYGYFVATISKLFFPSSDELVDNVLVSRDGFCDAGAKVYTAGHDMKDPLISPVYGDMTGFPPTILTSGTRDLLLSNTVRVHRKLRLAGVEAILQVYEGQSHAHYLRDDSAPRNGGSFRGD